MLIGCMCTQHTTSGSPMSPWALKTCKVVHLMGENRLTCFPIIKYQCYAKPSRYIFIESTVRKCRMMFCIAKKLCEFVCYKI